MFFMKKNNEPVTPHEEDFSLLRQTLNFKRIWLFFVLLTSGFAIVPVLFFALIDYNVTRHSVESEAILRSSRQVSNAWRSVSFFLNQRKSALSFAVYDNRFEDLSTQTRLASILANLQKAFGDFTDIGVIDATGRQIAYEGPYNLVGKDYSDQEWFKNVLHYGAFISDIFLGFRNVPHLAIAIKYELPNGSFYVLRATLEHQLSSLLAHDESNTDGDLFLINPQGVIQTQSRYFGDVLNPAPFSVPAFSSSTNVIESKIGNGPEYILGYAFIPDTPFILISAHPRAKLMEPWIQTRKDLTLYLVISITVVLLWVVVAISYMVRRLSVSDQRRIKYLHMLEYSNKLATVGRLAAGVAHEINNPLAVINEKAGWIKDMFTFKAEYSKDPKLIETVNVITASVERCSRITRRLLRFARHMDVRIQAIDLKEVITEVLGFMEKEAEYRSIEVDIQVPDNIPRFESDRGKLQQILLNLVNNSFAAMSDGGRLKISTERVGDDKVSIICSDNGCGISEADIRHVFEPFFSTKAKSGGGTGLGLSITYGLVKELGGNIDLSSEVNKGTTFKVTLPLKPIIKERLAGEDDESIAG
ncbi:MAG: two-component sensor histidine kinase [Proteobacteria bacterium]|nr:two-component sensor histidine kinase [Pseudomonadota bacterium]MBU4469460.1 two-component sensor histidine kinase [Pseudomonadota bacterium]